MTDISPNVIDHLTARFGNQTRLAAAAGVRQSSIAGRKKTNSLSHDQMRRILIEGPRMGIAVTPDDFFPERQEPQPEAANDATPTEKAA